MTAEDIGLIAGRVSTSPTTGAVWCVTKLVDIYCEL